MRALLIAVSAALLSSACSRATDGADPAGQPLPIETMQPPSPAPDPTGALPVLDPTQLDFSKIALSMRIPSSFRAYPDGAQLQINITNPRLGVDIAESFALVATDRIDSPFLASQAKDGFSFWTYGTRPEDSSRLAALSAEVARLKAEAPGENEMTFSAAAAGCWNEPAQTPGSLARTLYIRVVPEQDFQLLVPEQLLNEGDIPGTETFWGACAE